MIYGVHAEAMADGLQFSKHLLRTEYSVQKSELFRKSPRCGDISDRTN
jgi:hypothetical protein